MSSFFIGDYYNMDYFYIAFLHSLVIILIICVFNVYKYFFFAFKCSTMLFNFGRIFMLKTYPETFFFIYIFRKICTFRARGKKTKIRKFVLARKLLFVQDNYNPIHPRKGG